MGMDELSSNWMPFSMPLSTARIPNWMVRATARMKATMLARLAICIAIGCFLLAGIASAKKKKPKKEPPEITQVLELPKDPPQAVVAQTDRLVFQVSPSVV